MQKKVYRQYGLLYRYKKSLRAYRKKMYICELILRNLPKWFGIEEAIKEYILGVRDKMFFL